eukprot:GHVU01110655.1.p1 GENE.GHVU01110655.1~~GHVU01110655.1.p1  ORF type:complete len:866 (+),score=98.97 GHVU01110655.1:3804-6401(+)
MNGISIALWTIKCHPYIHHMEKVETAKNASPGASKAQPTKDLVEYVTAMVRKEPIVRAKRVVCRRCRHMDMLLLLCAPECDKKPKLLAVAQGPKKSGGEEEGVDGDICRCERCGVYFCYQWRCRCEPGKRRGSFCPVPKGVKSKVEAASSRNPDSNDADCSFPADTPHYVVCFHGVDGGPGDYVNVVQQLLMFHRHLFVLVIDAYTPNSLLGAHKASSQSVHYLKARLLDIHEEVRALAKSHDFGFLKIKLSFIGHSFGGVVARSVAKTLVHSEWPIDLEFVNFITLASPHVGIVESPGWVRFGAVAIKGRTGRDLKLATNDLEDLTSDKYIQALARFRNRTVYGNTANDLMVGPLTSLLVTEIDVEVLERARSRLREPIRIVSDATDEWVVARLDPSDPQVCLSPTEYESCFGGGENGAAASGSNGMKKEPESVSRAISAAIDSIYNFGRRLEDQLIGDDDNMFSSDSRGSDSDEEEEEESEESSSAGESDATQPAVEGDAGGPVDNASSPVVSPVGDDNVPSTVLDASPAQEATTAPPPPPNEAASSSNRNIAHRHSASPTAVAVKKFLQRNRLMRRWRRQRSCASDTVGSSSPPSPFLKMLGVRGKGRTRASPERTSESPITDAPGSEERAAAGRRPAGDAQDGSPDALEATRAVKSDDDMPSPGCGSDLELSGDNKAAGRSNSGVVSDGNEESDGCKGRQMKMAGRPAGRRKHMFSAIQRNVRRREDPTRSVWRGVSGGATDRRYQPCHRDSVGEDEFFDAQEDAPSSETKKSRGFMRRKHPKSRTASTDKVPPALTPLKLSDQKEIRMMMRLCSLQWNRYAVMYSSKLKGHCAILWHGRLDITNEGTHVVRHLVQHSLIV